MKQENTERIDEFTVLNRNIGEGGFSTVMLCQRHGTLYAVKRFQNQENMKALFVKEVDMLKRIHKEWDGMIRFYEAREGATYVDPNGNAQNTFVIIMEYVSGGELQQYLYSQPCSEILARTMFKLLLSTIDLLHNNNICHRDIKWENVMVTEQGKLKLIDFGSATELKEDLLTQKILSGPFTAPQVYSGKYSGRHADIFSLGVLLFCMHISVTPFNSSPKNNEAYQNLQKKSKNQRLLFWSRYACLMRQHKLDISSNFKNLVQGMLQLNPQQRLTTKQIRDHVWMQGQTLSDDQLKKQFKRRKHY